MTPSSHPRYCPPQRPVLLLASPLWHWPSRLRLKCALCPMALVLSFLNGLVCISWTSLLIDPLELPPIKAPGLPAHKLPGPLVSHSSVIPGSDKMNVVEYRSWDGKNIHNYNNENHLFAPISYSAPWGLGMAWDFLLGAQSPLFWLLCRPGNPARAAPWASEKSETRTQNPGLHSSRLPSAIFFFFFCFWLILCKTA